MPVEIRDKYAAEQSTFIIEVAFTDDNGDPVTPATMAWSLVDSEGAPINSRDEVAVSDLAAEVDIVLSGDDLAVDGTATLTPRWVVFEGTYNSDAGTGLALNDQVKFYVQNLKKIT